MRKKQGFMLMMTLCITGIMGLLLLTTLNKLVLYQRAMNRQEIQHQQFYQLEHLAKQIMMSPPKQCIRNQDEANQVINHLIHAKGCSMHLDNMVLYYLIEDLGDYPCMVVFHQEAIKSTHHYRLTLLAHLEHNKPLIQVRFITPSPALFACSGDIHYGDIGVSSWRHLADVTKT